MKQLPNIFTLGNLLFGCLAIVCILQNGLVLSVSPEGTQLLEIPERIYMASLFMVLAAAIDFFDGYLARLFKVNSEMGKQLDSLADVVSFGVAPGLIVYQFLRLSYAQMPNGLDIHPIWILPAFLLPCAGAYRLARFNISGNASKGFTGLPIPAAGLLFASFPLIYWTTSESYILQLLLNKWFWYGAVLLVSYLMVSTIPMLAPKFDTFTFRKGLPFIILIAVTILCAVFFGYIAAPLSFIAYVILSLLFKPNPNDI